MEKKQTAVNWLEKQINSSRDLTGEIRKLLFQAKQMEIIQIERDYNKGIEDQLDRYASTNSAKYYQETYGKEPKEIWIAISQSPLTGALKATTFQQIDGETWLEECVEDFKKRGIAEAGGLPVIKIIKTEI
jgi:hypothetical protein